MSAPTPYGHFYFVAPDNGETGLVFLFKIHRREPIAYVELPQARRLLKELEEAIRVTEARQLQDEAAEGALRKIQASVRAERLARYGL